MKRIGKGVCEFSIDSLLGNTDSESVKKSDTNAVAVQNCGRKESNKFEDNNLMFLKNQDKNNNWRKRRALDESVAFDGNEESRNCHYDLLRYVALLQSNFHQNTLSYVHKDLSSPINLWNSSADRSVSSIPWTFQTGNSAFPVRYHDPSIFLQHFRKSKRIRTAFSPTQLLQLEKAFETNHYVVGQERKDLSLQLGLSETQVKVWFQNRRTKQKRATTEEEMTKSLSKCMSGRVAGTELQRLTSNVSVSEAFPCDIASEKNEDFDIDV